LRLLVGPNLELHRLFDEDLFHLFPWNDVITAAAEPFPPDAQCGFIKLHQTGEV
jgi:hypothetical protein